VQITGETVGEVKAVADMHQRKAEMARQSDAFIALPGTVTFFNCHQANLAGRQVDVVHFLLSLSLLGHVTYVLDPCLVEA
jgi:hypothetical protein